jgi:hypothetical protein
VRVTGVLSAAAVLVERAEDASSAPAEG